MEVNRTILHRTIRRVLAITAGIILIAAGIAGLILPLLPGWPFIAAGIILLWPKTRLAIWLKHLPAQIREWFRKRRGTWTTRSAYYAAASSEDASLKPLAGTACRLRSIAERE